MRNMVSFIVIDLEFYEHFKKSITNLMIFNKFHQNYAKIRSSVNLKNLVKHTLLH